ncbi:MAG: glycosyltransferase [Deltaproteobacteria bacterium]|nr:glycosyltransferase [Deltaproteobacteria bacterium]MBW2069422.1 glycosyltransferase [Deltaproteobacteria bacterium]
MRVAFISTYPPIECGIATYTSYLVDAMRGKSLDVYVICHAGGTGNQVFQAFDYEDRDLPFKAFNMAIRFTPDVVHIQHEFGLFGPHLGVNVIPLILLFRLNGIPVVVTLHTVYPEIPESHRILYEGILTHSSKVIVHEEYQKKALIKQLGNTNAEKIVRIPHGARLIDPVPQAKEKLGLPQDKKIILVIGYFRPSKNFELAVDILPEVLERFPNAVLVFAGKIRGHEHIEYRNMLFNKITHSPKKDSIYLIRGQLPQEVFDTVLSAADVVLLPYRITSQSGILAHCLAFGKPVVTSSTEAMRITMEKSKSGIVCGSKKEFVDALVKILNDSDYARELGRNAREYVRNEIAWPIIADKHIDIYTEVMERIQVQTHVITVD